MFKIRETYVNKTEGYTIDRTEFYEPYTQDTGDLYRRLQQEYGKCVSKVYVDDKDGKALHVGWVFEKKQKYEDVNEYYIQETWIEIDNIDVLNK